MVDLILETIIPEEQFIDIPEDELHWSTVFLSDVINNNHRLDASVFNIEGKHARQVLKDCKWEIVNLWSENGLIKDSYYPGRFKRIYTDKKNGVPFYLPSQISELNPKPNKYISTTCNFDINLLKLKKDTILLSRSGTIGKSTIVSRTLEGKVFSDDVIRMEPTNLEEIGYVYAFLISKIGQILINTNNYGAVISHIEPEHLQQIPIPNPDSEIKRQIHELIMYSYELRDQSNELIDEAQNLIVSELQLPPIEELKPQYFDDNFEIKNYQVKISQINERIDASYHVPIVNAIIEHIQKYAEDVTTIGDEKISKSIILPGRFKRVYVEERQGVLFFGGKQLYELEPSNKKYLSLIHHEKRINEQLILKENMIMITCSGTIGKINIAPKHWDGWTANQHIIRIVPFNKNTAGYIYTWLSSDYGYELINRFTYGAVVDEINDKHVEQVQIPLLKNKNVQQKINDLVLEANQKRYEAYVFEEEAIQMLDNLVLNAE